MVSPWPERRGTNRQVGDEWNFGASGRCHGGGDRDCAEGGIFGREAGRSNAIDDGAFWCVGREIAANVKGRLQAELSATADAQGSGPAVGLGESVGGCAADDSGRARGL